MKHIQRIDTLKNIKKQWIAFSAIVIIAALGVMAYLGIHYAASAMKRAGTAYYEKTNYRDVEMVATLLMSDIDTEKIREVKGVEDAEGVFVTDGYLGSRAVTVQSVTKRVSVPILDEGRMPKSEDECVVELPGGAAAKKRLAVGRRIRIVSKARENAQYLKRQSFKIVGIVRHPDHVSVNMPENLYVLVDESAFDKVELDNHFMKAEIALSVPAGQNTFDEKGYFKPVSKVMKNLETLSVERAKARDDEIREKGEAEIAEKRKELEAAKKKLDAAKKKIDDKDSELRDAKKRLDKAKKDLKKARKKLDNAKAQLDEAAPKLEEARAALAENKAKLDEGKAQLDAGAEQLINEYNRIEAAKNAYRDAIRSAVNSALPPDKAGAIRWADNSGGGDINDPSMTASRMRLTESTEVDLNSSAEANAERIISESGATDEETAAAMNAARSSGRLQDADSALSDISSAANEWDSAHGEYLSKYAEYQEKLGEYNEKASEFYAKESEYNQKLAEYRAGEEQYSRGMAEYKAGMKQYKEAKKLLEEKKREYRDRLQEYKDGVAAVDEMQEKLYNLDTCKWFGFDRRANASFVDLSMVTDNLSALGMTFSLLFVVVGAIVCYATIGRMVDEQRSLIGTSKALGLFRGEILPKYMIFGGGSTILGIAIGIAAAYLGLQRAILAGYRGLYVMGDIPPVMLPSLTVMVAAVGLALSVAAVMVASSSLLHQSAVKLMRVKAPSSVRIFKSSSISGSSLYRSLIVNNMVGDLRNVGVTIASVAGCCALLVVGFTLKSSVDRVMDIQFGEIVKYDKNVDYIMGESGNTEVDMERVFQSAGVNACKVSHSYLTYQAGTEMEIGELYVVSGDDFTDYHSLSDVKTGEELAPPADGILIQKRMAEIHGLKPGDRFRVYDANAKEHVATVGGIFENYTGRTMVMSRAYYSSLFKMEPENNRYLVQLDGRDEQKLFAALRGVKGFVAMRRSDGTRDLFKTLSTTLNKLIAGLIVMAAMMGLFVILNLANLSIMQKKNDLIVMRINGFTVPEVKRYVSAETYVTTALGILFGCVGGAALAYRIIRTLEAPHIQLYRHVNLVAWALAAVITGIMMLAIYRIALRRVGGLKMTELE